MKLMTILIGLTLSTSVWASKAIYEIDMKLNIKGKPETAMGIMLEEGQKGSIVSEDDLEKTFIEVVAEEAEFQGNKGILMKFKVGHLTKDGSRKIISQPKVLAKAGEEAQITLDQEGKPEMSLNVVAKRK